MHVSLSELEATLTKAAKGVGLPFGIGEEIGRAIRRTAVEEFDCLAAVVAALDAFEQGRAGGIEPDEDPDGTLRPPIGKSLSSLLAGPTACDLLSTCAAAGDGEPRVDVEQVDVPLVVLVEVLALAAALRADLTIAWPGDLGEPTTAHFPAGLVADKSGKQSTAVPQGPLDLSISLRLPGDDPGQRVPTSSALHSQGVTRGFAVEDKTWQHLMAYADRLLVESSEASRLTGAGAGTVDRD